MSLKELCSLCLPEFYSRTPDWWFVLVEQHFAAWGLWDDNARYNRVIGALPTDIWQRAGDLLMNPPAAGSRYEFAKDVILKGCGLRNPRIPGLHLAGVWLRETPERWRSRRH